MTQSVSSDDSAIRRLGEAREKIMDQLSQVIVGQQEVIEELLISLFSRGHCLLEGVPGLAKTLMISTLARTLNLSFSRIQFTPDLMPADITGTEIIEENKSTGARERRFLEGPLFANVILADEINRTPPKTQAALLEAMQERQVTVGRQRHPLSDPFFVLGDAESDRAGRDVSAAGGAAGPLHVQGLRQLSELRRGIRGRPANDVGIASGRAAGSVGGGDPAAAANRPRGSGHPITSSAMPCRSSARRASASPGTPDFVEEMSAWGAGPRAVQFLILGGKARALLHGRTHVSTDDIQALAKPVLRHRLVVNFAAESEGVTPDDIVDRLLSITPTKEDELTRDARFQKIFAS